MRVNQAILCALAASLLALPAASANPYVQAGHGDYDQPCADSAIPTYYDVWFFLPDQQRVKVGAGVECWKHTDDNGETHSSKTVQGDVRTIRLIGLGSTYQEAGVEILQTTGFAKTALSCHVFYSSWHLPTPEEVQAPGCVAVHTF